MRLPLHNLEAIVCFSYPGVSPALMGACAERNIGLAFLKPSGKFLARVSGRVKGNLLLRKRQYQLAEQEDDRVQIAKSCLLGKISNTRTVINRAIRDHALLVDVPKLQNVSGFLKGTLQIFTLRSVIAALPETMSTPFFPFCIPCSPTKWLRRWKRWDLTRKSGFCTLTGRAAHRWRWI